MWWVLKEVLERGGEEEEKSSVSPLMVLDQLIVHGHDVHEGLSRR